MAFPILWKSTVGDNTNNPPFEFVSEYRPRPDNSDHEGEDAHQLPVGQEGGLYFAVAFEAGEIVLG